MAFEDEANVSTELPLCVVIDTNIWRRELLLRTPMGAAVLHAVRQLDGRLGLPAVIEREVLKHGVAAGCEAVQKIEDGLGDLRRVTGGSPAIELPGPAQIEEAVAQRIRELDVLFERVPFTLRHAEGALDRVYSGLPPNGPKNQQYKDSAAWEAILDLAGRYRIVFVTADMGFFRDRSALKGLATNLRDECATAHYDIVPFETLAAAVEYLQPSVPSLDYPGLEAALATAVAQVMSDAAAERGFQTGEMQYSEIQAYATETIDVLAVAFGLHFDAACIATEQAEARHDARIDVSGACSFRVRANAVKDLLLDRIAFSWADDSGEPRRSANVY
ncbi:MAG: hypothetical protein QOD57_2631, partial [Actinomycetota bacterium]|nr:hypothetical protein [Actinomycetota bacterium]